MYLRTEQLVSLWLDLIDEKLTSLTAELCLPHATYVCLGKVAFNFIDD
jgi:hypothetical protein